jgi:alpha-L-rhamnosidase
LPDGSAAVEVGSGRHSFTCTIPEHKPIEKPVVFSLPEE